MDVSPKSRYLSPIVNLVRKNRHSRLDGMYKKKVK